MSEALTALAVGIAVGLTAYMVNRSLLAHVRQLQEEIKDVYELLSQSVKSGAGKVGISLDTDRAPIHSEVVREDGLVERSDGVVLKNGVPVDFSPEHQGGPLPMDDG